MTATPEPTSPLSVLPLDLLPSLLSPLTRRQDLWSLCLVSREWNNVATPLLYSHIRFYGRDLQVTPLLFRTLSVSPRLCRLMRTLEMRVYPLSLKVQERLDIEEQAVRILRAASSLRELRWTRKGAITDRVLEAIRGLPRLTLLELNAHTNLSPGSWSADHLLKIPYLRSLSLILPDRNVASALPAILAHQAESGHGLEELTVLSRESPVINDEVFEACYAALSHSALNNLALAGCSKLTGAPLLRLLPTLDLQHLALEATNIHPSFYASASPFLSSLVSLKVTHPGPRHATLAAFFPAITQLLRGTPNLMSFTVYHSGTAGMSGIREWPVADVGFVQELSMTVGAHLRKFECSGVLLRMGAVEALNCPEMRDLVIHIGHDLDLARLASSLATFSHLRTLHIMCQRTDVLFEDIRRLAMQSSRTLQQIGFRNQVWLIRREMAVTTSEADEVGFDGDRRVRTLLERWDRPYWPEQLLVDWWRESVRFVETAEAFGAFRRSRYGAEDDSISDGE